MDLLLAISSDDAVLFTYWHKYAACLALVSLTMIVDALTAIITNSQQGLRNVLKRNETGKEVRFN